MIPSQWKIVKVELVMKDLHVRQNHPQGMARWLQICREEITQAGW